MDDKPNGVRSPPSHSSSLVTLSSKLTQLLSHPVRVSLPRPAPIKSINGVPVNPKDSAAGGTSFKVKPNHTLMET
jgi:hypothetical protein